MKGGVCFDLDLGTIQKAELTPASPSPEQVLEMLFQAMQEPPKGVRQEAHRPMRIELEDARLAAALTPELEKMGIGEEPLPGTG